MLSNAYCDDCLMSKHLNDCPADAAPATVKAYQEEVRRIVLAHPELSSPEKDALLNAAHAAAFGVSKDFSPIKRHFNALMLALEPAMVSGVRASADPLRRAVQYAMVGNFIDFAAMDSVDEAKLEALIDESDAIPIDAQTLEALRRELMTAQNLTYIADNCGEIVADRVLMQTIRELNPSLRLTAVVKGAPIVNDATQEDAQQVRLCEVAHRVVDTGCGIAGCPEQRLSVSCVEALDNADVLISKGQANYETLCGCGRNLYYIFMCKCELFMDRFGVPRFSGILTREENEKA